MKILRLRSREQKFFKHLDPCGLLSRLSFPEYFALVGVEPDGDESIPSALVIGSLAEDRIIIEWICVEPILRFEGRGTEMIESVINLALEHNIPKVSVRLVYEDRRGRLAVMSEEFFKTVFPVEEELPGEWCKELGFLLSNSFFSDKTSDLPKACVLKDVRKSIVNDPKFPAEAGTYDPEVSTALVDGNNCYGLFLVKTAEKFCYPFFLQANSESECKALLLSFANAAMDNMDPDAQVRMIPRDSDTAEAVSKIYASQGFRSKFLTADIEEIIYE